MSEFRASPGERIIDVIRDRTTFILTKAGKPVAKLCPIDDDVTIIAPNGRVLGALPLTWTRPCPACVASRDHRDDSGKCTRP